MKKATWMALLLAGGKGTRLNLLTRNMVKPAIPVGGKYRIIDFALSNCKNSGIDTVGILTHYCPHTLHSYIRNNSYWSIADSYGGLTILPSNRQDDEVDWHEGTSHAVFQ